MLKIGLHSHKLRPKIQVIVFIGTLCSLLTDRQTDRIKTISLLDFTLAAINTLLVRQNVGDTADKIQEIALTPGWDRKNRRSAHPSSARSVCRGLRQYHRSLHVISGVLKVSFKRKSFPIKRLPAFINIHCVP